MADYDMEVMQQTEKHEIAYIKSDERNKPAITGGGKDNCFCGACQSVICRNINRALLKNLAFQCPSCSTFNWLGEI